MPGHVIGIVKAAGKEFGVDHGGRLAAALSYYTIFSLVPILFLLTAIAGFVFADDRTLTRLVDQVTEVAGAEVGGIISDLLTQVGSQAGSALSIGILLAAYAASGVFQQVQAVLAVIFHVPEERRRAGIVGWLVKRGIALAAALVLASLAFTPIVAVAAIGWLSELMPVSVQGVVTVAVPIVSLLMLMVVVALTFQLLTPVDVPRKAAIRGGIATALTGVVAAVAVGWYLTRFGASGTLGALGGVAILLVFFNLMWVVYVLGAEVTKVYADYLTFGDIKAPSEREEAESGKEAAGSDQPA